jgi:hypothetical protein
MHTTTWQKRARQALGCVLLATGAAQAGAATSGVGLNLGEWDYWSPDLPMIDQFKRASGWYTQCTREQNANCPADWAWDTLEQDKLKLDANGWVTELPAMNDPNVQYRWVAALLFSANHSAHPAGQYTVLYDGEGVIEYGLLGRKISGTPGRDLVQVSAGTSGLQVMIRATKPGNHVRNLRVLPPGGICDGAPKVYAASAADCVKNGTGTFLNFEQVLAQQPNATWHPHFLSDARGFRSIRFLDWGKTNSSTLAHWADRPKPAQPFWTGPYGIPVEEMIDFANKAGANPWINLPMKATDDYVRRFARLAKARLAAKRTLIVEYSNEPWNGAFHADDGWMQTQATEKWGVGNGYNKRLSWYGLRSVQVCDIVKAEFGADASRVKCVANGQAYYPDVTRQILECQHAKTEVGQACGRKLDAVSVAPYFGHYLGDPSVRSIVNSWASEPDGGMGKMFAELLAEAPDGQPATPPLLGKHEGSHPGGAVAAARQAMANSLGIANEYALPLWTYEGGQHLTTAGPGDNDPVWIGLFTAANRHARMATAYERYLQDWRASGGQTMTLFQHIYAPGRYGAWGLKETQFTTAGPKWNAVLPWRDSIDCWWPGCKP